MTINYRAIHTRSPWRKARHSSVEMAIKGPDGALNLLRRKGRVGKNGMIMVPCHASLCGNLVKIRGMHLG